MYQWRISKYDPKFRDERGVYTRKEWTSVSDIGESFEDGRLDKESYLLVEGNYVEAIIHFVKESGVSNLVISDLDTDIEMPSQTIDGHFADVSKSVELLREGEILSEDLLRLAITAALRDIIWCKIEAAGKFYIHFGYDYYVFIGSIVDCPLAMEYAKRVGLFVESIASPFSFVFTY